MRSQRVSAGEIRIDGANFAADTRVVFGADPETGLGGFEAGDVVTGINGVSLDNPTNTMVLYNSLRTAGEVVFELERGGQPMTLSVSLDAGAQ